MKGKEIALVAGDEYIIEGYPQYGPLKFVHAQGDVDTFVFTCYDSYHVSFTRPLFYLLEVTQVKPPAAESINFDEYMLTADPMLPPNMNYSTEVLEKCQIDFNRTCSAALMTPSGPIHPGGPSGTSGFIPNPVLESACEHQWDTYDSGWSKYDYCAVCDKKKEIL